MESLKQQRKYRKAKTMRRRLFGGGLLTAALAGLILIIPTGSDYTVSQRDSAPDGITEELVITEIAESTDEAPFLTSLEEEPTGEVALGFSASGQPEYVTAQPPLIEIPGPILIADNWMPSSPASTDDLDAQPTIHPQGPRAPAIAGVPGGDSGPRGSGVPSPGGGSPGGGNSGPRSPSSPISSGPAAPPSDPTPGDNGPMVAGPTTTPPAGPQTASAPDAPASPPANNQPGPVNLPDELSGPVVGSNDDPQDDWLSPGNSPGILEAVNFTLGGQTLLFEILGPSADAPVEYDQLIVSGNVNLDAGNIVFAFINGYVPDAGVLFDLIVAGSITYDERDSDVDFYYGFFDSSYPLHAPYDLSNYFVWTPGSGINREFIDGTSEDLLQISYNAASDTESTPTRGPNESFNPVTIGAEIPAPAPLLLLATGLLLAGSLRRRA